MNSRASKDSVPEWVKEVDFPRVVENTLAGTLLLAGRFVTTYVSFLRGAPTMRGEILKQSEFRTYEPTSLVRPLTFLVLSAFAYLAFTITGLGTFIPVEPILERLGPYVAILPRDVESLKLSTLAAFMIPFVLLVALHAWVAARFYIWAGVDTSVKVQLNLDGYGAGAGALTLALTYLLVRPLWLLVAWSEGLLETVAGGGIWLLALGSLAALTLIVFRYLQILRTLLDLPWPQAVFLACFAYALYMAVALLLVILVEPLLSEIAEATAGAE